MEKVQRIKIPDKLLKPLTDHVKNIIEKPNRFITSKFGCRSSYLQQADINDPLVPGINDDFLLKNHDIKNIMWNEYSLEKATMNKAFEIAYPSMAISIPIIENISKTLNTEFIKPSGNFLYPEGGYMGWHTNSDAPCIRVYLVYVEKDNAACFKYLDNSGKNPKIITDWDKKGWNIRVFKITNDVQDYLWHSVNAEKTQRFSFGYRFK